MSHRRGLCTPGVAPSSLDSAGAPPDRLPRPSRGLCDLPCPLTLPRVCLPRVDKLSLPGRRSPGPGLRAARESSSWGGGGTGPHPAVPVEVGDTAQPSACVPSLGGRWGPQALSSLSPGGPVLCCGCGHGGHWPRACARRSQASSSSSAQTLWWVAGRLPLAPGG